MAKKRIEQCRTGKDFVKFAQKKGAEIETGRGSHHKVYMGDDMIPVPVHAKELATGTRFAIIKAFTRMGIHIVLVLGFVGLLQALI